MRIKIKGPGPKDRILASRNFAAYSEGTTAEGIVFRGECEITLSVEQTQQIIISLFQMLPANIRPVLTWPAMVTRASRRPK